MENFSKIRELIAVWDNSFGFLKDEIEETEDKLNVKLPAALFHYYEQLGKHPINFYQDTLLLPFATGVEATKRLYVEDNYLVFYRENQSAHVWGIRQNDLNLSHPPVYRRDNNQNAAWVLDTDSLVVFLHAVAFWQYNSGFDYIAYKIDVPNSEIAASLQSLKKEDFIFHKWQVEFYRNTIDEIVAVHRITPFFKSDSFSHLYITCRSKPRFEALVKHFNVAWDAIEHEP